MNKDAYRLIPIDPDNPEAGYEAELNPSEHIDLAEFNRLLLKEGLPTDEKTLQRFAEALEAGVASLAWEGWDVDSPVVQINSSWPLRGVEFSGGAQYGRVTASRQQLIERILSLGYNYKHGNFKAYFQAQEQVASRLLQEGHSIELPLAQVWSKITGRFHGPDDYFDPERHELKMVVEPKPHISNWMSGFMSLEEDDLYCPPRPRLECHENGRTGDVLAPVIHGDPVRLQGYWLRVDNDDPQQGVFLSHFDDLRTDHKIQKTVSPSMDELIFTFPPDLPSGYYTLWVQTIVYPRDGLQAGYLDYVFAVE